MRNLQETLTACRGQYVALLEGDDYWTGDQKLQKQVDFLDSHSDFAVCCHRTQIVDESNANQESVFPQMRQEHMGWKIC
jgi:hypothetical protein